MTMRLEIGLSPCPNDTYIFHALLHQLVNLELPDTVEFAPIFADVEKLNELALEGALPVTKVSAGIIPEISDKYAVLSSGGALGFGCGPLLVARSDTLDPHKATIAIPGKHTTANLLLDLHGRYAGPRVEMLFSDIIPAIQSGEVDGGVLIHEGRFVYSELGLKKLVDLGQWWEDCYSVPLPLGVIVIRRDVDVALGKALEKAIAESILFARANPEIGKDFILDHAQELNPEVIKAHINTFVTDFSCNLGEAGKSAICKLARYRQAASRPNLFLS